MRITLLNFTILVTLLMPTASFAENTNPEISYVAPPKLVECKTESTCDREPKHLEEFVQGFYEWYVVENSFDNISKETKRSADLYVNNLKKLLTKSFFHHWKTSVPYHTVDDRYCSSDSDTFLCAQDYDETFFKNGKISFAKVSDTKTTINITFSPVYQINVNLKVERGAWRIDSVTSPD